MALQGPSGHLRGRYRRVEFNGTLTPAQSECGGLGSNPELRHYNLLGTPKPSLFFVGTHTLGSRFFTATRGIGKVATSKGTG